MRWAQKSRFMKTKARRLVDILIDPGRLRLKSVDLVREEFDVRWRIWLKGTDLGYRGQN